LGGWRPAGAEVQLAVRPEAVELSALSAATGQNAYKAELRGVSFLGDHYLYQLDIDGLPLTVTDTRSFPGPSVTVRIPPSACRVLPRESGPVSQARPDRQKGTVHVRPPRL
jgi:ABC-type Fe3+/spermidine/putrescine transport system ATPase subunit